MKKNFREAEGIMQRVRTIKWNGRGELQNEGVISKLKKEVIVKGKVLKWFTKNFESG